MKKATLFLLIIVLIIPAINAQQGDTLKTEQDKVNTTILNDEDGQVSIGTDEIVKTEENKDTTHIKLGKKDISIIDEGDGTSVKITEPDKSENEDKSYEHSGKTLKTHKSRRFKGHWAGFEFGLNNYLDNNNSLSHTGETAFLDLNTGKSWNFNLNFAQYSIGLGTDRFGLVTGMGLEFSNYHFNNNNNIIKSNNYITELPYTQQLTKNKLQTTYLTIPLLLEGQILDGKRSKRIYISGGVIGGFKLGSFSKVKYIEDGSKKREKEKDDFYLSPFRYGLTARVGYKMVKLYANYYMTPLFIKDKGPELHPVALGLVISF